MYSKCRLKEPSRCSLLLSTYFPPHGVFPFSVSRHFHQLVFFSLQFRPYSFVPLSFFVVASHSLPVCASFRTDGGSGGHVEVSGWGDGLQGREDPRHNSGDTLRTFPNGCAPYTLRPESLAFLLCLSGVHICVCLRLLTEWGFVEGNCTQSGTGNRLESEPPCPDSLISSLIHGLTAGSTRTRRHTGPAPKSRRRRKST